MKAYHITFFSKNKNSLNNAFLFLLNNFKKVSLKRHFKKKTKRHIVTILKSPHVNKKAQEQFESHMFSQQLSSYSFNKFKNLFFFRNINENILSDLKLKIKFSSNKTKEKSLQVSMFHPNNFKIRKHKNVLSQSIKLDKKRINNLTQFSNKQVQTLNMLKVFDIYGELIMNNPKSLDSSVGRAKD